MIRLIILVLLLFLGGYFFYEKFPIVLRIRSGKDDSLKNILTSCGKNIFNEDIPFETGKSFYIYEKEFSAWRLTVSGNSKNKIDQSSIDKSWKKCDSVFLDQNLKKFSKAIQQEYYFFLKEPEEKIDCYTTVLHGSTVFLRISADRHYYHLLIWHR